MCKAHARNPSENLARGNAQLREPAAVGASIMRPITREIIDRRQPIMRWSAVFAGAFVSVALWVLLQMLGMGIGLAAIHVDDAGSLRDVGIGTGVWTLVAPLVAMFIGGIFAGRLAGSRERSVGSMHGLVMWALTSVIGTLATVGVVSMLASGALQLDAQTTTVLDQQDIAQATDSTGKILLGAGISQLLALLTAVLGGAAGVRRNGKARIVEETDVRHPHDTARTVVPPPPPIPSGPAVAP